MSRERYPQRPVHAVPAAEEAYAAQHAPVVVRSFLSYCGSPRHVRPVSCLAKVERGPGAETAARNSYQVPLAVECVSWPRSAHLVTPVLTPVTVASGATSSHAINAPPVVAGHPSDRHPRRSKRSCLPLRGDARAAHISFRCCTSVRVLILVQIPRPYTRTSMLVM